MRLEGCEVAVVGAGLGGLASALALARRGAHVRVYERAPALGAAGAGIQLGPNAVAVLEALGIGPACARAAQAPAAVDLRDHRRGRLVARVPLGSACVARYGRPYWQIHRADLVAILAQAAAEARVVLRLGAAVARVAPEGPRPAVVLASGGRETADLVVAADGMRSAVRAAWFDGTAPRFTGHVAWRGVVPAAGLPRDCISGGARVAMGPGRHVVSYPLRAGTAVNIVAVEARAAWAEESWTRTDDPANLRAAFAGWDPATTALLARIDTPHLWGLFDHAPLPRWTQARLALVGDACHPMLPFLAQGAAMALEDAWVLADALATFARLKDGLASYAARRQPRAGRVVRAAARNGRVFHLAAPWRAAAHLGLASVSRAAPSLLLRRLDWLYGADVVRDGA